MATILKHSWMSRTALSQSYFAGEEDQLMVSSMPTHQVEPFGTGECCLRHRVRVSRGWSVVSYHIDPEDFRAVLEKMIETDRKRTIQAIGSVLANYPDYDWG